MTTPPRISPAGDENQQTQPRDGIAPRSRLARPNPAFIARSTHPCDESMLPLASPASPVRSHDEIRDRDARLQLLVELHFRVLRQVIQIVVSSALGMEPV